MQYVSEVDEVNITLTMIASNVTAMLQMVGNKVSSCGVTLLPIFFCLAVVHQLVCSVQY